MDDDENLTEIPCNDKNSIEKFQKGFSNYPELELIFENNKRNKCFIKVKDKNSINLCIDIFPYDFSGWVETAQSSVDRRIKSIITISEEKNTGYKITI